MVFASVAGEESMEGFDTEGSGSPYLLAELSRDAVLCFDRQWKTVFANAAAYRLTGSTQGDLLGRTPWEIFPDICGLAVETLLRQTMDTGRSGQVEFYRPAQNIWLDIKIDPLGNGIAIDCRDVTERKRAEEARKAMEAELQEFLDAAEDSVLGIDRGWTIVFCNRAARERATADPILGSTLWTRFPTSAEEPFQSHYRRSMDERVQTQFEAFVPSPYNAWLKVIARPRGDGILVWYSDITARKDAEAVRDANARQLQQVLDATSDAVVSLDRNWNYTFVNRQATPLLGGRTDLIGKNVWKEFPAAIDRPSYAIHHRTMNERIPTTFEDFYPDPHNRWSLIHSRPSDDGIVIFFHDTTEEHRAREVLLDQQATLSFVQQAARIATWVVDLATEEIQIGDGSYPVYGRPNEEVRELNDIRRLVLPEDLAEVLASAEQSTQADGVTTHDYRVVAPDGGIIWLERRSVRVCDEREVPTHLRGMTTDISVRKRNEERLAASEAKYRVLTDLNPQSIWMGNAEGRIVYANQGFIEYSGIRLEGLTERGWLLAFDPLDRERVLQLWTESIATGRDYQVEARLLRAADGASRWWSLRALPVRDEAGKILSWLGVAHDIQEQRAAAEELRQKQAETERQRAELEAIYENAPIGLALFDSVDFRWLRLNETQAAIVGMNKEELLNTRLFDVVGIPGVQEMFERVAAGTPVLDQLVEGELPARPGEHRYWTVNYHPVYGSDGTVQAITAASLEITQQKKSELALIQSEKLAAVGRLASSISHEINNPLEAITNLLYLVATDPELPEGVKVYVLMAQSELARVSQIATQTLRFHRQAMKPTCVTAEQLVRAVLDLYQGRLANSAIKVESRYASRTPVLCFENDIRQVLNNLIANAIDAMRTGGRLLVRAHDATGWTLEGGLRKGVRITIADTGHGMSPSVRLRVFEPFYTTKDLNGTGLGLWISAGIVQHHRGRLTVRSSEDPRHPGTVFSLFLPLADEVAPS